MLYFTGQFIELFQGNWFPDRIGLTGERIDDGFQGAESAALTGEPECKGKLKPSSSRLSSSSL